MTLQDQVRKQTEGYLTRIAQRLWSWGVHPDALTFLGFVFVVVASIFISLGHLGTGAVILVLGLPLDALDGAVARVMNRPARKFGGLLDSTLDRYADGVIFGGLMVYFASQQQIILMEVTLFALLGSFATSYIRARAGEAGVVVKVGLVDRLVRMVALLIALFIPATLPTVMIVLAVAGNFTAIQRLLYARQRMEEKQ